MFKALHQLAQASPLILTIVAEDEQLRVTLMPQLDASSTVKAAPHPLSIVATPDELDADFASAIGIFAPGVLSVLEQAQAVADANANKSGKPADKDAKPAAPGRGRRAGKALEPAPAPAPTAPQDTTTDEDKDLKTLPLPLAGEDPEPAPPPPASTEGAKREVPAQTDALDIAI